MNQKFCLGVKLDDGCCKFCLYRAEASVKRSVRCSGRSHYMTQNQGCSQGEADKYLAERIGGMVDGQMSRY